MTLSVNLRAWERLQAMLADAEALGLAVSQGEAGEILVDAGRPGSLAAGLRLAELCLGGLGAVSLGMNPALPAWPATVTVASSQPVIACLGSQYAGWNLAHGEKPNAYFAMGSGPARALSRRETLFGEIGYADSSTQAVLVLESGKPPPAALLLAIAAQCGVRSDRLAVLYAPTQSLAGSAQVVARVLEVALHKAHALRFELSHIVDGIGAAPLPPPHPDFVTAMGRTNDAIIFGGRVHLFVRGSAAAARMLAEQMPASTSRDYGRPFAEIFRAAKGDFYAIDGMLFSPAEVTVTAIESGETFRAGALAPALLDRSFSG
jgi:methenyltetrahydromethanopterin cyclohydrolase